MTPPGPGSFGTALVAIDGTILSCDAVYAALLASTPDELVGRSVAEYADTASGYSPAFMINLLLRTKQPLLTRRDYVRRDGTKLLCEVQLCLLRNASGLPDRIYVVVQPVVPIATDSSASVDRPAPNA